MQTEVTPGSTAPGDSAAVTVDRFGYHINGNFFRRVTSIVGTVPKPWLGPWAAKTVAEYAVEHRDVWSQLPERDAVQLLKRSPWEKRDVAGDRGRAVHEAIHAYVEDRALPDDLNEDELDCAIAAESFLRAWDIDVHAAELTVFSPKHNYAGTLDVYGTTRTRDGIPDRILLDWKTSGAIYAEFALQLSAYAHAELAVVNGRIEPWGSGRVDRLLAVHIDPEAYEHGYAVHELVADTTELFRIFRALNYLKTEWTGQFTSPSYGKDPKRAAFKVI